MNDNGEAVIVWSQYGEWIGYNINAISFSDGSWGASAPIEDQSGYARAPQIVIDHSGNAIAAWIIGGVDYGRVGTNRFQDGSWGTATLIDGQNSGNLYPKLAIDAAGYAIAVWHNIDPTPCDIHAAVYTAPVVVEISSPRS